MIHMTIECSVGLRKDSGHPNRENMGHLLGRFISFSAFNDILLMIAMLGQQSFYFVILVVLVILGNLTTEQYAFTGLFPLTLVFSGGGA